MYVCVCNAVTESDIAKLKNKGLKHIIDQTGLGCGCERCIDGVKELIGKTNETK